MVLPVIIDNMMNLELLYFASKVTGDPHYAEIANSHAITTAREQFREDYSNYHVVNYDPETGKVLHKQTCQGILRQFRLGTRTSMGHLRIHNGL